MFRGNFRGDKEKERKGEVAREGRGALEVLEILKDPGSRPSRDLSLLARGSQRSGRISLYLPAITIT